MVQSQYQNIIIANYSIHSLALINWAQKNLEKDFCILSVDTGFGSSNWEAYLQQVFSWLNEQDINHYHLKSENSFQELVKARKQFPSQQFSWCAGFLKGITLLNKIDEIDPNGEAKILLAHRKDLSKVSQLLKNVDEEEKYDYRALEYPLLEKSHSEIVKLTQNLPFRSLERSLECQPCIHFTQEEFELISTQDRKKIIQLETQIGAYMFDDRSFGDLTNSFFIKKNIIQELSKACSWEYSCGL